MSEPLEPPFADVRTPHGDAAQIPVTDFLKDILPPLQQDYDIDRVLETLSRTCKGSPGQQPLLPRKRRKTFYKKSAATRRTRKGPLQYVQDIVRTISLVGGSEVHSSLHCSLSGCMTNRRTRDEYNLPDVYLSCDGPGQQCTKVTIVGELKETSTDDVNYNISQVTESVYLCMHHDPRRRFVYAFTIENATMRFWFGDRAQMVVSEPFDCTVDRRIVVHFFASLMHAEPQELGLDPTMIALHDCGHYDITVHCATGARKYRTLELLSDIGTESLQGRGTRVWKAVRLEDGRETGDPVALKDTWTDPNRDAEGDILNNLRRTERPEEYHSRMDRMFPTVECHGDVYLDDVSKVLDCTRLFGQSGNRLEGPAACRIHLRGSTSTSGQSATDRPVRERKVHYRIVFKEICKPLHNETSFATIFRALGRVVLALQAMHVTGWVHRDISTGNILLTQDGLALLADLEHAKEIGPHDEFRVGTADFMAVEVDYQRYRHRPSRTIVNVSLYLSSRKYSLEDRLMARRRGIQLSEEKNPQPLGYIDPEWDKKTRPFQYNPLHDLESLWWIAMYYVLTKEIVPVGTGASEDTIASRKQRTYAANLFYDQNERSCALDITNDFATEISGLSRTVMPIAEVLDDLRQSLVLAYRDAEEDLPSLDHTCAKGIYEEFHAIFDGLAGLEELQGLVVRPFSRHPDEEEEEAQRLAFAAVYESEYSSSLSELTKAKRAETAGEFNSRDAGVRRRPYLPRRAKERC